MSHITTEEKKALELFKERLQQEFKGEPHDIQLFGSKARGDADKFSDVDVLVITKNANKWQKRARIHHITSRVLLETGIVLSPKVFSEQEIETMKQQHSVFWQTIEPDLEQL